MEVNAGRSCPVCGGGSLTDFFSTRVPVHVGQLCDSAEKARDAPRGDIDLCHCPRCGFVFNRSFDPERLSFAPGYEASLVHSPTFVAFSKSVARRLVERYELRGKTIVEIGCGHGEFLRMLSEMGPSHGVGFDPTIPGSRSEQSGEGSIRLVSDFYSSKYAHIEPDLVCCLSVFEDILHPSEFLAELRATLGAHRPALYFEVFNGGRAIEDLSTWSIHYEQCNYWSVAALSEVFERNGFELLDSGTCYGQGEYVYVEARPTEASRGRSHSPAHPFRPDLERFAEQHERTTAAWRARLAALQEANCGVAVWGTGGKGISFLNAMPSEAIDSVVDINPNRQGRFIPGSGHRIENPETLATRPPGLIVITNPLYQREIVDQVREMGIACDFAVT